VAKKKPSPHEPQTRSVKDMKDSRGEGSGKDLAEDAPKPVRIKVGGRRKGTPKGGAAGTPDKVKSNIAARPADVGGEDSTKRVAGGRATVKITPATTRRAAGPNDLEAARRVRIGVLDVMQRHPYRIPHSVARERIGDLDYEGGTAGSFDVGAGISFLAAHAKHRESNPRSVPMDHPWLIPMTRSEKTRSGL
jgi:hypothetical protein